MGDEDWQAVRDVSVGDVVGSYDPVTGQWMCGRYDAIHAGGVQPTVKTDHACGSATVVHAHATLIARGTLCPGHKRVPRAHGIINFGRGL